jgi:hypothetical protein
MSWLADLIGVREVLDGNTPLPRRRRMSVVGATVTDDPVNDWTRVAITGGVGGGDASSLLGVDLAASVGAPNDGDYLIFDAGSGEYIASEELLLGQPTSQIVAPLVDGDVITWDGTALEWKLAQPPGAGSITAPLNPTDDGKVAIASGGDLTYSASLTLTGSIVARLASSAGLGFDHGLKSSLHDDTAGSANVLLQKSRGTPAAPTPLQSGDDIGALVWSPRADDGGTGAYDGTAAIVATVIDTPGVNNTPTALDVLIGPTAGSLARTARFGVAHVALGTTPALAGSGLRMTDDSGIRWRDSSGAGANRHAMSWSADALSIGYDGLEDGPDTVSLGAASLLQLGIAGSSAVELDTTSTTVRNVTKLGIGAVTPPDAGQIRIGYADGWEITARNDADELRTILAFDADDLYIGGYSGTPVKSIGLFSVDGLAVLVGGFNRFSVTDTVAVGLPLTIAGGTGLATTGTLRTGTAFSLYGLDGSTDRQLLGWASNTLILGGDGAGSNALAVLSFANTIVRLGIGTDPVLDVEATGATVYGTMTVGPVTQFDNTDQTTDATVTTLAAIAPGVNKAGRIAVVVTAREASTQVVNIYSLSQSYETDGSGNVTLRGTLSVVSEDEDAAGWDCTIDASTTSIRVRATGEAATTIDWRCAGQVMVA